MELRLPGSPVPDPFFAAIRRRHPDVDLVALPREEPAAPLEPVDEPTLDRVSELVAEAAAALWSAVAPGSGQVPETRLQYAGREADVRAVARVVEKRTDGYALLLRLRHELEQRGWSVQRPPGRQDRALERLVAEQHGGTLVASYAEPSGAVLLELASAPLPVGVERARELVR